MKISKRLMTIAEMIPNCNRIIDVGCDHALLDIYLINNNIVNKALAIDIHDQALRQAQKNVEKVHIDDKIDLCLNDGLKGIEILPNDVIVISGMGCRNIIKILENSTGKINKIIIQANNEHCELRKWLHKKGFIIKNEVFVYDNNKYYIIIDFEKGQIRYSNIDYWLGPFLQYNKEYIDYMLKYYYQLEKKIPKRNFINRLTYKKKTFFLEKKSRSL